MPEAFQRVSIEFHSEAGQPLGQVAATVDFAPACEWTRFEGARTGRLPLEDYDKPASVLPLWHAGLSRPYLEGFRVLLDSNGSDGFSCDFSTSYFKGLAVKASRLLVDAGKLKSGDRFVYLITAYPGESEPAAASSGRFSIAEVAPAIPIQQGGFSGFLRSARAQGEPGSEPLPVFIPGGVLVEVTALTQEAQGIETGGFLIGHLRRDAPKPDIFAEITAQVPAKGTLGEETKLSFTGDSWTAVRSAILLRRRGEILLGWWHSHPVKNWDCKDCPVERQKVCALSRGFLSEHDRALHRAVFSRSWCVAMVVSDVTFSEPTVSLFGWNQGTIEARGFYVMNSAPPEPPGRTDAGEHTGRTREESCRSNEIARESGPCAQDGHHSD